MPRNLRMEDLLHDLLDHLVLFLDETLLAEQLRLELLIFSQHLIELFLQIYLFLVEPLLVRVFQGIWDVGLLVQVLFRL